MSSGAERREFLRIPVAARVKFRDGDREEVWFSEDISEGGLFLKADNPPFTGTLLDLEISLPYVDELVEVRGEVVWRHEGRGCGVRFVKCTAKMRDFLRLYLERSEDHEEEEDE